MTRFPTQDVPDALVEAVMKSVLAHQKPTVARLHEAMLEEFGAPAPSAVVADFKLRLGQQTGTLKAEAVDGKTRIDLLRQVVAGDDPTMDKLEQAFRERFNMPVPKELAPLFDMEVKKKKAAEKGLTLTQYLMEEAKKK